MSKFRKMRNCGVLTEVYTCHKHIGIVFVGVGYIAKTQYVQLGIVIPASRMDGK